MSTRDEIRSVPLDAKAIRERIAGPTETDLRVARNAVTAAGSSAAALDHQVARELQPVFETVLDDWTVTNQKRSGRCWMFAGLNLLRAESVKQFTMKSFEFSQSYLQFWDKLERANYFLTAIIETVDRPIDDRTVAFLLDYPVDDGGQWNMFAALVDKYGLVPKPFMPETFSSSNTRRMNNLLTSLLRRSASRIRDAHSGGAPISDLEALRDETVEAVLRFLRIDLGDPPERFLWQWRDDEREFHRTGEVTPIAFARDELDADVSEYVCLVSDPRSDHERDRTYTVEYLGNVVGAPPVVYLNVGIESLKEISRRLLEDGRPVWFGCDTGAMSHTKRGIWHPKLYDYEGLYGIAFDTDREQRLRFHDSLMSHAMLFTGIDAPNGKTRQWRVENSWGDQSGDKGFFTMADEWFDEYVYEIAAPRTYLTDDMRSALETEPIVLPPWDPMGALAR